ncbi:MAG TPA: ribbon-helix-helix domain-containing protein [Candidatus Paceibacterota bacterium]|nr:ribbon-helix-helix domain-containing protein [Candidatus Paceibacterota bacterium]
MRTTLNISMPVEFKKSVDLAVKEGKYASVSEFFRDTFRAWENERLVRELKESQLAGRRGEFKILHSLGDLD